MTIYMYNVICVTNRNICKYDFLERIEQIAQCTPKCIILREKELSETEYKQLAKQVLEICKKYNVKCILHSFVNVAVDFGTEAIHVPLPILRSMQEKEKKKFTDIGTSCHSVAEAKEAQVLGCTYIIAGHVFATDCKKDVPPRGLDFLESICQSVSIPVYAIGGISGENIKSVCTAGAKSGCVMSGLMQCTNVKDFMKDFIIE